MYYQIPVSDVGQDGILPPIFNRRQVTNLPYIYLYVERAVSNSTSAIDFS